MKGCGQLRISVVCKLKENLHNVGPWIEPSQETVLLSKPPQQDNRKSHVDKTKQKPSHETGTQSKTRKTLKKM